MRQGHQVRAFDRVATPEVTDALIGNLENAAEVHAAVSGVNAIVHLAAHPDDAAFPTLVGPNVIGLFNVLSAARKERVSRTVLASSIQTVGDFAPVEKYSAGVAAPNNHYALTKLWAEQMAEMYARSYGMSIIAARIGWMVRSAHEAERIAQDRRTHAYLSRADVAHFMVRAVVAEPVAFAVLYAVGPSGAAHFDLEPARRLIGYEPKDSWPNGLSFAVP